MSRWHLVCKNFYSIIDRRISWPSQITVNRKFTLWIGPHFNSKGGVASVIKIYKEEGFFNSGDNKFLPTMGDGSKLYKLAVLLKSFTLFLIQTQQIKLLHVHLSCRASFWRKSIFIKTAHYLKIPVFIHLHDSGFPIFYESSHDFQKRIIINILDKSDQLFVLSHEIEEFLNKLPLKVCPQIFPNPIILKTSELFRRESGATILFLGRITPEKGVKELLEAVAIARKVFPDVQLIIGGDGDMNWLQMLILDYQLGCNVTMKGWVGQREREALLQSSTLLVLPSYGEGQSMALLEAMESYLPVISTTVGGNTYLIDNGKNGLLVPPQDSNALATAIITILQNPEFTKEIVINARKKVEDLFDSKKVIGKVQNLYSSY